MQINADLIGDLARQKVVLFVGSGVSASARTRAGARIKQWEPFLRSCAAELELSDHRELVDSLLDGKDFLLACEILRRRLNERWSGLLHDEFGQMAEPSVLHEALVQLDQRLVVTTNFDKLLEAAWEKFGEGTHYPQVISKVSPDAFKLLRDDLRYILKLHGTIDDPESFIFTKGEYISRAFANWAYGELLSVLLSTHTFLFVGFSMSDPAVSSLIELHAHRFRGARPHYILQPGPIDDELVDVNKVLRKLYLIQYDPADDHAELVTIIHQMRDAMRARRSELVATASISSTGPASQADEESA